MAENRPDLTIPKNFANYAIYGLAGIVTTVSSIAYVDMRVQRNKCQEENNYFARESFKSALTIREQNKTIRVQDTAISEATSFIRDSIKAVNVKNFNGEIKIKEK